jgi:NADH-quinone oxidoreductase subunit N
VLPSIDTGAQIKSVLQFAPELLACTAIVLLLLLRLFPGSGRSHVGPLALIFVLLCLGWSVAQWAGVPDFTAAPSESGQRPYLMDPLGPTSPEESKVFGGMLVHDHLTVYLRMFLYAFAALVIWLSLTTGIPRAEDSADFYVLLIGSTVGMALMASATHLLMVFIGVEMASLPSYALAGFLKGKRQSSEAALKYVVYGGGAAGVMLYGMSLLAGKFGTGYLPDIALGMAHALSGAGQPVDVLLVLGWLFILIGIAFKLAAVPFHFWCPDVFEGAAAEVAGFLSVASKAAALALLARMTLILAGLDPLTMPSEAPWGTLIGYMIPALAFLAALTATFGNLAAYSQTNLKRLLAYSTIAHAGYMMMGLCTLSRLGAEAVAFYLAAYLFMNLGAFAVVAFLREQTGSEDLADFRGLVRRSPVMVITLAFFLLSLLGIPPLVGFIAKFMVFRALWIEGQAQYAAGHAGLGATLIGLLIVAGLNTVISAVYYLKVMKVMIIDRRTEDLEGGEPPALREPVPAVAYSSLLAAATLAFGVLWWPLDNVSRAAASRFRTEPGRDTQGNLGPQPKGEQPKGGQPKGGFPKGGFPKDGFPKDGFPKDGFPKGGFPKDGFPKDGFPKGGFPKDGFPKGGFPKDGFPKGGFPKDGFPKGGIRKGMD